MKRIACICVAFVLFTSIALAVDFDPKNYSTEELKEIFMLIEAELGARDVAPGEFIPWFTDGIGVNLPVFTLASGDAPEIDVLFTNTKASFYAAVENATEEDYKNYTIALQTAGYTESVEVGPVSFNALNSDGYAVSVSDFTPSGVIVRLSPPRSR